VAAFQAINFGYASAETERAEEPGLLIDGYMDLHGAASSARKGQRFLFLGYKGAGKSAIAQRLGLAAERTHDEFVTLIQLSDFPFTPFSKIIRGDAEPESKYPLAWSWILLIYLIDSFSRDYGLTHPDSEVFESTVKAFRDMGFSPTSEPGRIVRVAAKTSFKVAIPGKLVEAEWSGSQLRPAAELPDFVESLRNLVRKARSESDHIIIIDGLDDILTAREIQYRALAALIFEVDRLNALFRSEGVPAKIVLVCRTDLFERITGANKNKIRQDGALELDWYHDPRDPDSSLLIRTANLRAYRSLSREVDIFAEFLPSQIERRKSTKTYMLDMTRHTPRDFLQLLKYVQEVASGERVTVAQLMSGMRNYSIKYFLPEIQDEFGGYADSAEIDCLLGYFASMRQREFTLPVLLAHARGQKVKPDQDKIERMLNVMFDCGALGNLQSVDGDHNYYTFKYRNRHSTLNFGERIVLHRGLWRALNLI
jgi:hypothetical protein